MATSHIRLKLGVEQETKIKQNPRLHDVTFKRDRKGISPQRGGGKRKQGLAKGTWAHRDGLPAKKRPMVRKQTS